MRRSAQVGMFAVLLDSGADSRLVQDFLTQAGHGMLDCGEAGLDSRAARAADLVVLDEHWAARSGEALRRLRAECGDVHVPALILVSGQKPASAWLRAGYDDVLRLPIAKEELLARLDAFVRIRRASEAARAVADRRFRMTLDRAPVGIAHCTLDGRFVRANRSLCEMLALSEGELQQMELADLTARRDAHRALSVTHATSVRSQRVDYEVRHERADGVNLWLHVTVWLGNDELVAAPFMVAIITDVTERKRAEERLADLNSELEARVSARTAELQAVNHELEAFTASVSHDLRGPLRAIEGFADLLAVEVGPLLTGRPGHLLLRLRESATRMSALIDGLLGLSKAGQGVVNLRPVDLSELAREVVQELIASLPGREVRVEIAGGLQCAADPVLMRQVLQNLLSNALKYSCYVIDPCVKVDAVGEGLDREFFVRDNGAGFDPAHAAKLFEPFERLHSDQEFPGVGVGLATVRRILRRHGGEIRAESCPGKGATFYFRVLSAEALRTTSVDGARHGEQTC